MSVTAVEGSVTAVEGFRLRVSWRTTWELVAVTTSGAGGAVVGCGELSDTHDAAAAERVLHEWADALTGRSLADALELVAAAADRLAAEPERQRRVEITVLGGLDTALCDAAARQDGVSLAAWLGADDGPAPTPVYANINRAIKDRTPERCAEVASAAVADGFTAIKIAPFDFLTERRDRAAYGIELAAAVRDAIGPAVAFMIDCHSHLAYAEMLAIAPDLAALDLRWLEDPFELAQLADWRRIKDMVGVPLAGGEHAATEAELRPGLDAGVLDVVLPDAKHAGGVRRGRALGELVASYGAEVAMHNPSGPIATAASMHAQAGLATARILEYAYGETDRRAGVLDPPERVVAGVLQPVEAPGLGVSIVPAGLPADE